MMHVVWSSATAVLGRRSAVARRALSQRTFRDADFAARRAAAAGRAAKRAGAHSEGYKIDTTVDTQAIGASKQLASASLVEPSRNSDWQVVRREHFEAIPRPKDWLQALDAWQTRMGVRFRDVTHLMCALTHHGAFVHDQVAGDVPAHRLSNRSLEFLGDSVLGMAVASYLFQAQPMHQEGQLTQLKSALVNNETLSKICVDDLALHRLILVASDYSLARQSSKSIYVKGRTTIQAGAVEALIAAVYLDQGLAAALAFVNTKILPAALAYRTQASVWEPIGALQTLLQANGFGHPVYKHLPAALKSTEFCVSLVVRGEAILTESGPSYKDARVKAADAGYAHYKALFDAK